MRWHCPPDTGSEIQAWGRSENVISRLWRLPEILNLYEWAGNKHFVYVVETWTSEWGSNPRYPTFKAGSYCTRAPALKGCTQKTPPARWLYRERDPTGVQLKPEAYIKLSIHVAPRQHSQSLVLYTFIEIETKWRLWLADKSRTPSRTQNQKNSTHILGALP